MTESADGPPRRADGLAEARAGWGREYGARIRCRRSMDRALVWPAGESTID